MSEKEPNSENLSFPNLLVLCSNKTFIEGLINTAEETALRTKAGSIKGVLKKFSENANTTIEPERLDPMGDGLALRTKIEFLREKLRAPIEEDERGFKWVTSYEGLNSSKSSSPQNNRL